MHLETNENVIEIKNLLSNLPLDGLDQITTAEQYEEAALLLKDAKALLNKATDARKELTVPLDQERKAIIKWFRDNIEDKLTAFESTVKAHLVAYQDEQRRKTQEAQRKADEQAEKKRERLLRRARDAQMKGDEHKAEDLREQATMEVAPVVMHETPKVDGVFSRDNWKFEIVDASQIPPAYMKPDEEKIGKVVKALKQDAADTIPGIRVYNDQTIAART